MKAVKLAANVVMILPPAIVHGLSLIFFHYSSLFVLLGMFSLIMILLSDRVKLAGVVSVYLPAVYSLYLLVSGGNPIPFISLASGYILAVPIVLIISMITARTPAGLVSSYFSAYISSLIIYGAVFSGYHIPEKLFIYLVRGIMVYVGSGPSINLVPPEIPPISLLATPTAASTIALVIRLMTLATPTRKFWEGEWLPALLLALILGIPVGITTYISPSLASFATLAVSSILLAFLVFYSRRRDR